MAEPSSPSDSKPSVKTSPWPLLGGLALGWTLWGIINVFRLATVPSLDWNLAFWYGFPDAIIWAALTPLVVSFTRRHAHWRKQRWSTFGLHLGAAVVFALIHAAADASVSGIRSWVLGGEPLWTLVFFKVLRYGLQMNVLVYALLAGLTLYVEYERELARGERRAADLKTQLAEARLEGLERQLRPHFLFNALNTISGLMGADAEAGRRVVRRLGDLLRAGLEGPPGQRISLERELDLAKAYLEIEQARFEDRLHVAIEVDGEEGPPQSEALDFPVPALILQPLVENAVVHGVAPREEGGRILIQIHQIGDRLQVDIVDDGPGPSAASRKGFGVGLRSTRERLAALYGDEASFQLGPIEPVGTRARLLLPHETLEGS